MGLDSRTCSISSRSFFISYKASFDELYSYFILLSIMAAFSFAS